MKGLNIKALFVNHVEKMAFAGIVLMVLTIWAKEYFGGAWAPERRSPTKMLDDIAAAKTKIESSVWPEEKRKDFALVDFSERAATLHRPINTSRYELSTELFVPLNRPKEKVREPDWMIVESMIADWGHVVLSLPPKQEIEPGAEDMNPADEGSEDEDDPDNMRRDGNVRGGALAGPGGIALPGVGGPAGGRPKGGPGVGMIPGGAGAGALDAGIVGGGAMPGGEGMSSGQRAEGRWYVAVRGVFPIRQQLEKIQKALHLAKTSDALEHLEIMDFDLERQVAVAGDDPWSKPWEKMSIEYANQVLNEVDGFDEEPINMDVFDTCITMPLAKRMVGMWKDHALHPRIQKYVLTPEEQQRERALQARLLEEQEKIKAEMDKQQGGRRGGFAGQSHDFRQMGNMMLRGPGQDVFAEMAREMRNPLTGGPAINMSANDLSGKFTAVGRLLLFRYFDFDVSPGYAYRYRVRLKLRNPNFERSVSEVIDPNVVEGKDRWTEPSQVSSVAVLPAATKYFLKDVVRNPLISEGRGKSEVASVRIFDWHKELGTQVSADIPLKTLGQFLGGEQETTILNVAEPSLDKGKYQFVTEDILVDLSSDTELSPKDHPDLMLDNSQAKRGPKAVALNLTPEALVLDAGGDLRVLESGGKSKSPEERTLETQIDRERRPFRNAKKAEETTASPLDLMNKGGPPGAAMPAMAAPGATYNPRQKKKGKSADAGPMGMPGMPGMPGIPAPAGSKTKAKSKK